MARAAVRRQQHSVETTTPKSGWAKARQERKRREAQDAKHYQKVAKRLLERDKHEKAVYDYKTAVQDMYLADRITPGAVLTLPSPVVPGQADIVVVFVGATELQWGTGFIVRNKGDYHAGKSMELAAIIGDAIKKCVQAGAVIEVPVDLDPPRPGEQEEVERANILLFDGMAIEETPDWYQEIRREQEANGPKLESAVRSWNVTEDEENDEPVFEAARRPEPGEAGPPLTVKGRRGGLRLRGKSPK